MFKNRGVNIKNTDSRSEKKRKQSKKRIEMTFLPLSLADMVEV